MSITGWSFRNSYLVEHGNLVSYCIPAPSLTLRGFLSEAKGRERVYWENAREPVAFAGVGVAAELIALGTDRFADIQEGAQALFQDAVVANNNDSDLVRPRLFGGFSFRHDFPTENAWSSFSPANFILPHFQLTIAEGNPWLIINALHPVDEDPADMFPVLREAVDARYQSLLEAQHANPKPIEPTTVNYPMTFKAWEEMLDKAISLMQSGEMQKVVLSRVAEINFDERLDLDYALAFLERSYPNCYRFLFEPRPYHAFYGATPELLVKVGGEHIDTMALAASIKRGKTPEEDDQLAQQLMEDPKERHEHAVVVNAGYERLNPITSSLVAPDSPQILRLGNIQHLYTPISGTLKDPSGVIPLVELLHPTPALGGEPREEAVDFIQQNEPAPRGWYAAPVGWIDHRLDGAFGVAIRSAVAQDKRVWLYAGAGIVAQSVPKKEWDETAIKFIPMLNALGVDRDVLS